MSLEMFTFRWSTTSSPPSSRLFYLASFLSRPSHHKYSRRLLFFFPPAVQFWRCRRFLLAQPGATSAFGDDDRNNKLSSTLSISKKRGRKRLLSRFSSNLIGALDADVKAWTTLRDARKKRRRRLFLSLALCLALVKRKQIGEAIARVPGYYDIGVVTSRQISIDLSRVRCRPAPRARIIPNVWHRHLFCFLLIFGYS